MIIIIVKSMEILNDAYTTLSQFWLADWQLRVLQAE